MPFFEAGTEIFLHDYTDASVRVVVRGELPCDPSSDSTADVTSRLTRLAPPRA